MITTDYAQKPAKDRDHAVPRYHVVSVRVTDEERALLQQIKHNTRKNISDILREMIQLESRRKKIESN